MKKLMVIHHEGSINGSGIGLLSVLEMLNSRFDIVLYCSNTPESLCNFYEDKGYRVKTFRGIYMFFYLSGGPSSISLGFILQLMRLNKSVIEWEHIIHEEKPDIVLVNSMTLCWMWEPIKAIGAKAICHVREVLPNRSDPRARYVLNSLEHFDAVWFISNYEQSFFCLKHPNTFVIRDSLAESFIVKDCIVNISERKCFHALFVGGLSKLKGLDTILKAINFLDQRIVIDIAGYIPSHFEFIWQKHNRFSIVKNLLSLFTTRSERKKNAKMYSMLQHYHAKYPDRIILHGYKNNLRSLYLLCDALVFPSSAAHQSRPAFEVGFYKKPVIISDFVQTRENIRNGYNGLTFKPNDPRALAKSINELSEDSYLCRKLGENNYINSIEKHTYEEVKKEMKKFWIDFGM